jgi:hypothetical protein
MAHQTNQIELESFARKAHNSTDSPYYSTKVHQMEVLVRLRTKNLPTFERTESPE